MIKATARRPDGTMLIVLGLSEKNLHKLRAGYAVEVQAGEHLGLLPTDIISKVMIVYGETEDAIIRDMQELITKKTTVHIVPKTHETPQ